MRNTQNRIEINWLKYLRDFNNNTNKIYDNNIYYNDNNNNNKMFMKVGINIIRSV